ncbi:unnamed protein product [marine sediment metagenome]|uniref:Uncharacterized protein n=1 Tax=marine sediment metagenome TaxID=412755 RepID=X1R148_9ZZZZ
MSNEFMLLSLQKMGYLSHITHCTTYWLIDLDWQTSKLVN